jgi:ubiquinone/menaquinone biosynthesis C-methylase UbiE
MTLSNSSMGYASPVYLSWLAEFVAPLKQSSYQAMHIQLGHKVLDVGCGAAVDTIALSDKVGPLGAVVGIDSDEDMVFAANVASQKAGKDNIVHALGVGENLPFPDDYFDSCRCERVFLHQVDPQKILEEMIRVTNKNGWIVVADADFNTMSIDTVHVDIERKLLQFAVETGLVNGSAGRQLYRLFSRSRKLTSIFPESFSYSITNYKVLERAFRLDVLEQQALHAGVVSQEELQQWRDGLAAADSGGSFFGSISHVLVAGQKG